MKRIIDLPYPINALEPVISKETIDYHYNKHHKGYDEKLQKLIAGTKLEEKELEFIIKHTSGPIFNNAAQVWNHNFFWLCLSPQKTEMSKKLSDLIYKEFGSVTELQEQFVEVGEKHFGSGYVWLVIENRKLKIQHTNNANNPLQKGIKALLTIDLWEHAYYIDYRNDRKKYLNAVWNKINWDFVSKNL